MNIPILQVDAFTDTPFKGNSAAICLLTDLKNDAWHQSLATEMNLSETAFLSKQQDGYNLRWFTPAVEVDLCGHATLASTHALKEMGLIQEDEKVSYFTRSGKLISTIRNGKIELNFPSEPCQQCPAPPDLLDGLNIQPTFIGKNRMDYLVEVETEKEVQELKPDFARLSNLGLRGVMVTAKSSSNERDFVSRFFAPGSGIDEDPVTGSAHCCLAPYWAEKLGNTKLRAHQISQRGGKLDLELLNDRIILKGQAVTIFKGELCI